MGIVPENAQTRLYRDLVGRANQAIAARAGRVTLVSCGIPLHLKERQRRELCWKRPSHKSSRRTTLGAAGRKSDWTN